MLISPPNRLDRVTWSNTDLWTQFAELCANDSLAIAVIDPDNRHWTRREIADAALACSSDLSVAGVQAGQRVLLQADRTSASVVAALAVSHRQGILCCLPPGTTAAERRALGTSLRAVAAIDAERRLAVPLTQEPGPSQDARDSRCVLIAGTSGSTGQPKFVMHGACALNYVANACAAAAGLEPGEPIFATIAPDSAAGFAFTVHFALARGQPLVMSARWDAREGLRRITKHGCRWTTMVPSQLLAMVEIARAGDWPHFLGLRAVAVGGSAMTATLIEDAERLLGVRALRMFGLSECLAHCSTGLDDNQAIRLSSEGRPFPGTEIEAFDGGGAALPRGARGEAGVRGPSLFLGYAAGHGAGGERLTRDGFLLTGDEIVRDADGVVRVVGRIKDQIIRGGFNIDPAEVEGILSLHPAIAEIVVVPVTDARLGERACAVVRQRAGAPPVTLSAIRALLSDVALYKRKWPEFVVTVDHMDRLPSGKIDRRAMTRRAEASVANR